MKGSLEIGGKIYLSTKTAAEATGYTSDYIGQLAREGRVPSIKVGRVRFVEKETLVEYVSNQKGDIPFLSKIKQENAPVLHTDEEKVEIEQVKEESLNPAIEVKVEEPVEPEEGFVYEFDDRPLLPELTRNQEVTNDAEVEISSFEEKVTLSAREVAFHSRLRTVISNAVVVLTIISLVGGSYVVAQNPATKKTAVDIKDVIATFIETSTNKSLAAAQSAYDDSLISKAAIGVYTTISSLFNKKGGRLYVVEEEGAESQGAREPVVVAQTPITQPQAPAPVIREVIREVPVRVEGTREVVREVIQRVSGDAVTREEFYLTLAGLKGEIDNIERTTGSRIVHATYVDSRHDDRARDDLRSALTGPIGAESGSFGEYLRTEGTLTVGVTERIPNLNQILGNTAFDTSTLYIDSVNNRIGIGTTTPGYTLTVEGDLLLNGDITSTGSFGLDSITASTGLFTSATSTNFFTSNMVVTNGTIGTLITTALTATNSTTTNATTTNSYITNLRGDEAVFTSATSSQFAVTGVASTTHLVVSNSATFSSATSSRLLSLDASRQLTATDLYSWLSGTNNQVLVSDDGDGTVTFALPQDIATSSVPTFAGINLTGTGAFSGTSTFTGVVAIATSSPYEANKLTVGGDTYIDGDLTVTGDSLTLGNITGGTLAVNSRIISDLIPNQNATYDLGSPSFFWDDAYIDTLTVNNISAASTSIGGTASETFTINSDNSSTDTEDSEIIFYRGTVVPNATLKWNSTTDRFEFNQNLFVQNETVGTSTTFTIAGGDTQGSTHLFVIEDISGVDTFTVGNSGATSTNLYVAGTTAIGGTLGVTATSTLATTTITRLTATQDSFFEKALSVTGNTSLAGTLGVTGATTLGSTFAVIGTSTLATTTATRLTLSGAFEGTTGDFSSTLNVDGAATFGGTLGVTGHTTLTSASSTNLTISGNTYFPGGIWNSSGRVGIGATSLATKLTVVGTIYANASQTDTVFDGNAGEDKTNIVGSDGYWALRTATNNSFNVDVLNSGSPLAALTVLQSGNVGIGTTNPNKKLEVNGGFRLAGGNDTFTLTSDNSALQIAGATSYQYGGSLQLYGEDHATNPGDVYIISGGNTVSPNSIIQFGYRNNIGYSPKVTIDTSGNMGIGTTTPSNKLDIWGGLTVGTSSTPLLYASTTKNMVGIGTSNPTSLLQVGSYFNVDDLGSITGNQLHLNRAAGSGVLEIALRPDLNYIGMMANNQLVWTNTVDSSASFFGATIDTGIARYGAGIVAATNGSTGGGSFRGDYFTATSTTATSTFAGAFTVGTSRFVVNTDGNVGIGTTSPSYKLDVVGNARVTGSITATTGFNAGSSGYVIAGSGALNYGGNTLKLTSVGNIGWASNGSLDTASDVGLARSSAGVLKITNGSSGDGSIYAGGSGSNYFAGNVGIGSSTPSAKLAVTGSGTGTGIAFRTTDSSNVPKFTVYDNGNVAIGTASPYSSSKLEVIKSGVGAGSFIFGNTDTTNTAILALSETTGDGGSPFYIQRYGSAHATTPNLVEFVNYNNGAMTFATNGSERMRISSTGLVGIGTTTPASKLQVLSTSEQLRLGYNASNYASFTLSSAGDLTLAPTGGDTAITGNLSVSGTFSSTATTSATVGNFSNYAIAPYFVATSTTATSTFAGALSVGTLSPSSAKLTVAGTSYFSSGIGINSSPSTTNELNVADIGGDGVNSIFRTPSSFQEVKLTLWADFGDEYLDFLGNNWSAGASRDYNAYFISKGTDLSNPLFTLTSTGNVGIGTTTPASKLTLDSGDIEVVAKDRAVSLRLDADTDNGAGDDCELPSLYFGADGGTSAGQLGVWSSGCTPNNETLRGALDNALYYTSLDTSSLQLGVDNEMIMTIGGNSKNVGIGTTSLSARLIVTGTSSSPTTDLFALASSTGSRLFTVTSAGDVAIGTTNPQAALHLGPNSSILLEGTAGSRLNRIAFGSGSSYSTTGDNRNMLAAFSGSKGNTDNGMIMAVSTLIDGTPSAQQYIRSNPVIDPIGLRLMNYKFEVFRAPTGVADNTAFTPEVLFSLNGNNGNVGIGTSTPSEQLEITGNFKIASTTATTGIIYQGDAPILHTYGTNNLFVGTAGNLTLTGDRNIGVGVNVLQALTTGRFNTALGYNTLKSNTEGENNTAIGELALEANTTGSLNTAIGIESLKLNTTGSNNSALGSESLESNTTGASNVAVGSVSLVNNTTGSFNTAIGRSSLFSNTTGLGNIGIGYRAIGFNSTGASSTVIGTEAAFGASGASNLTGLTILGYRAGYNLRTGGDYNVLLGFQAGDSITTGANNILIGKDVDVSTATQSNFLNIGNTIYGDLSSGNVGIGTTTPRRLLDIASSTESILRLTGRRISSEDNQPYGTLEFYDSKSDLVVGKIQTALQDSIEGHGKMMFYTQNGVGDTNLGISIADTGYVGIGGIDEANLPLVVNGAIKVVTAQDNYGSSANAAFVLGSVGGPDLFSMQRASSSDTFIIGAWDRSALTWRSAFAIDGENNGYIGIGTTSPDVKLQVQGGQLKIKGQSSGEGVLIDRGDGNFHEIVRNGSDLEIDTNGATNLRLRTGNSDRLFIAHTSGNVGIGTTNPSSKLDVEISETEAGGILVSDPDDNIARLADGCSTSECGWLALYDEGTEDIRLIADGTASWINTGGNVGIGTTTPGYKLTVNGAMATISEGDIFAQYDGDSHTYYPVFARYWDAHDTYTSGTYIFGNGTNGYVGIEKPGGSNISAFNVKADKSFFSGNVGIGTTSLDSKLRIVGTSRWDDSTVTALKLSSGVTGEENKHLRMGYDSVGSNDFAYLQSAETASGVKNLVLQGQGGNVGIGTTNPTKPFYVSGTNTGTDTWSLWGAGGTKTNSTANTSNATYFEDNVYAFAGTHSVQNMIGSHNKIVVTNTSTANRIRALVGRVEMSGSGAASDVATLASHFDGNSSGTVSSYYGLAVGAVNGISSFQNTSSTLTNTYGVYIGDMTSGTQINTPYGVYQEDTGARNYFAGNVGIGTTSPSASLHVVAPNAADQAIWKGSLSGTTGYFQINHGASDTSGFVPSFSASSERTSTGLPMLAFNAVHKTGAGTDIANKDSIILKVAQSATGLPDGLSAISNANVLSVYNGNASNLFTIKASGNVGIGTSSPTEKLHVVGDSALFSKDLSAAFNGATFGIAQVKIADSADETRILALGYSSSLDKAFIQGNDISTSYKDILINPLGGNVGIGTSTPNRKLDVIGDAEFTLSDGATLLLDDTTAIDGLTFTGASGLQTELAFRYTGEGSSAVRFTKFGDVTKNWAMGFDDADNTFRIAQGYGGNGLITDYTNQILALTASGNMGIGTSDPQTLLEISKASDSSRTSLRITNNSSTTGTSGGDASLQFRVKSDSSSAAAEIVAGRDGGYGIGSTRDSNLQFHTQIDGTLTERLRIDSNGNVGIGTTTPSQKLTISSGNIQLDNNQYLRGKNTSGTEYNVLGINSSNMGNMNAPSGWQIYVNSSEKIRIDSSGNVGIGTTSPQSLFHVAGSSAGKIQTVSYAGSGAAYTYWQNNDTGYGSVDGLTVGYNGGGIIYNRENTHIAFGTNDSERMRITSSGSIGIGTTSPLTKLHVTDGNSGGTSNSNAQLTVEKNSNSGIQMLAATNASATLYLGDSTNNTLGFIQYGMSSHSTNANKLILGTNGSTRLVIDSSGNVGIGTSSPSTLLHLANSSGNSIITLERSSDPTSNDVLGALYFKQQDGGNPGVSAKIIGVQTSIGGQTALSFHTGYASTLAETVRIDGDGKIGVGTSTPATTLHIASATGAIRISDTDTGKTSEEVIGSLEFETMDLTNTRGVTSKISAISGANNIAHLAFFTSATDGSTLTEKMRLLGNGSLGINTTNPNQGKVEVKGGTVCVDTNSDDNASSCIASESDERLKENIETIKGATDMLLNLRGVRFDWKVNDPEVLKHYPLISRYSDNVASIGLIAQEVQGVLPEAIMGETIGDDEVQYLQLDYEKIIPVLVEGFKEEHIRGEAGRAKLTISEEEAGEIEAFRLASDYEYEYSDKFGSIEGLDENATSTANNTEKVGVLRVVLKALGAWIENGVTKFERLYAHTFDADLVRAREIQAQEKICIGETCLTEEELKSIIENQQAGVGSSDTWDPDAPSQHKDHTKESEEDGAKDNETTDPIDTTDTTDTTDTASSTPEIEPENENTGTSTPSTESQEEPVDEDSADEIVDGTADDVQNTPSLPLEKDETTTVPDSTQEDTNNDNVIDSYGASETSEESSPGNSSDPGSSVTE